MALSRRTKILGGVVAAVVAILAVGGVLLWQVFGSNAPEVVSLSSPKASGSVGSSASGVATSGFAGTWTVDGTSGSLADGTSTFAGYRVEEQLSTIGANVAVGRTQNVTGSMTIDGTTITALSISVDMTTLRSDEDRRDESLRSRGLETDAFPTATFTLTQPIDVGKRPAQAERIEVTAVGDLTLHGVTKSVQVPIQAQVNGDEIEAVASVDVALADFQITPPTGFLVLSIADHGTIEMHLLFQKGSSS
jgi:polyisoprenoid-binding protein YceI